MFTHNQAAIRQHKLLYLGIIITVFISLLYIVYGTFTSVTLENPVANQNVSGTVTVRCSANWTAADEVLNYTFISNSSSGTAAIIAVNVTSNETNATALWDTTATTDGVYDILCNISNATAFSVISNFSSGIQVDNTPPSVASIIINTTLNVTSTTTLNLTVNTTDGGVGVSTVSVNGTPLTQGSGDLWHVLNETADFANCPTDGACVFTINSTDTLGNENISETITITVDDIGPAVNAISINDTDGNVSSSQSINFTINATDSTAVSTVTLNGTSLTAGSGDLWHTLNSTSDFTCPTDGNCTFTVTATDSLSNTNTSETITITIDDTAPSVNAFTSNDTEGNVSTTQSINFTVNVTDANSGISTVTLNGTSLTQGSGDLWHILNETADFANCPTTTGTCTFTITATDLASNQNTSETLALVVDGVEPSVNSITVNSTLNVTNSTAINFTVNVTDTGAGLSSVTMNGTTLAQGSGNLWHTINTTGEFGCAVPSTCTFHITATDIVSNTNTSETIALIVDETPPSVNLISTNDTDGNVTSTQSINFTVNVTDANAGVSTVTLNGTSLTAGSGDLWHTLNTTAQFGCPTNNACAFTVTATDGSGNQNASETITITVDDTAPSVNAFTIDDGNNNVTSTQSINFTVNTTDTNGFASVTLNGTSLTAGSGDLWHTLNTTSQFANCPTNDDCIFTVTSTDLAGNSNASETFTVTVDDTAPSISIGIPTAGQSVFNNVTVNWTVTETNGVSNTAYYLDSHIGTSTSVDLTSFGTTTGSISLNLTAGYHTIIVSANDTAGNWGNSSRINFSVSANHDVTGFENNLTASIGGGNISTVNVTYANGTDASGSLSVNASFRVVLNVNSTGTDIVVGLEGFSGTNAAWNNNFTVTSDDTPSTTDIQSNFSTTIANMVRFDNTLDNFIAGHSSYYGSVVIAHNASNTAQITGVFWYENENDTTTRTTVSACTTVGATQTYTATETTPCFNVTAATSTTVYLPHFSTITAENDTTPPSVSVNAPSIGTNSLSTFQFNITVSLDTNNASYSLNGSTANTSMSCSSGLCNSSAINFVNSTNYTVSLFVWDAAGNLNDSESVDFFVNDNTPPGLSSVLNSSITSSGATVTWATTEFANGSVNYGTTTSLGTTTGDTTYDQTSQSVTLSGLSASTEYFYNVTSCDFNSNCNATGIFNFTTSAAAAAAATTSSSSGGGGGGLAVVKETEFSLDVDTDFSEGKATTLTLTSDNSATFTLAGEPHKVTVTRVFEDRVLLTISSKPFTITLSIGETREVDVNDDKVNDVAITLAGIKGGSVDLSFRRLAQPPAPAAEPTDEPTAQPTPTDPEDEKEPEVDDEDGSGASPFIMLVIIVLIIAVALIIEMRRKKVRSENEKVGSKKTKTKK